MIQDHYIQVTVYDELDSITNESQVIIEQFTGLKDKNGKEIYEGDIVGSPIYVNPIIVKIPSIYSSSDFADRQAESFEVIGNIHQNPELIKQ